MQALYEPYKGLIKGLIKPYEAGPGLVRGPGPGLLAQVGTRTRPKQSFFLVVLFSCLHFLVRVVLVVVLVLLGAVLVIMEVVASHHWYYH